MLIYYSKTISTVTGGYNMSTTIVCMSKYYRSKKGAYLLKLAKTYVTWKKKGLCTQINIYIYTMNSQPKPKLKLGYTQIL